MGHKTTQKAGVQCNGCAVMVQARCGGLGVNTRDDHLAIPLKGAIGGTRHRSDLGVITMRTAYSKQIITCQDLKGTKLVPVQAQNQPAIAAGTSQPPACCLMVLPALSAEDLSRSKEG